MCLSFLHLRDAAFLTGFSTDQLGDVVKFIFSWVILLPVGVILSGKFLTQRLKFPPGTGDWFRINIPLIFSIKATGGEVFVGFAWFFICLLVLGVCVGKDLPDYVNTHFHVDPGQSNALCFMSSLLAASISFLIYLFAGTPTPEPQKQEVEERNKKIDRLTRDRSGIDPTQLPGVDEP